MELRRQNSYIIHELHQLCLMQEQNQIDILLYTTPIGYSPPLTNLAAQTEFSQPQKDCSGSSKDAHGL